MLTQLEAKRKAVFVPSLHNIVQELERELDERLEQPPKTKELADFKDDIRRTVMQNARDVVAQYEAQESQWFMNDQHYQVGELPSTFDCCSTSCHGHRSKDADHQAASSPCRRQLPSSALQSPRFNASWKQM